MEFTRKYIFDQVSKKMLSMDEAMTMLGEIEGNKKKDEIVDKNVEADQDIAIIGMSCRFPDAVNIEQLWQLVSNGEVSIGYFPEKRKHEIEKYLNDPYINQLLTGDSLSENNEFKIGGYFQEIDHFDAAFFSIPSEEADFMDPAQRLFLEIAYDAFENGGYGGDRIKGTLTGVFVGSDQSPTPYYKLVSEPDQRNLAGSNMTVLSKRLSYLFDLKGPSLVIDSSCSSGLVAVHTACGSLRNGECDMALAGGVNILFAPFQKDSYLKSMESPSNMTRVFDQEADGIVWGEGMGAVLLKSLEKALQDGDHIHAVIKGSAINNDGTSSDITIPSTQSQANVISKAIEYAGVHPETIEYIEAHGAGTLFGDAIEINAVKKAFKPYTDRTEYCSIGSIKANIGHTGSASGIASLLKVILSIQKGQRPPTPNFSNSNRYIDFEESPFFINKQLMNWETDNKHPRRAGVTSIGFNGTNCHMIVEQYDNNIHLVNRPGAYIFTLSAQSQTSLIELMNKTIVFLENEPYHHLESVCYTSNVCRGHYAYRYAIVASSTEELIIKLSKSINNPFKEINAENIYFGYYQINEKNEPSRKRSANILSSFPTANENNNELLVKYVQGANFDWDGLYNEKSVKVIPLPSYSYDTARHWAPVFTGQMQPKMDVERDYSDENRKKTDLGNVCMLNGRKDSDYTDMERTIAKIWAKELGLFEISIYDNFYRLGGNYSLLICILNRIEEEIGKEINNVDILEMNTIYQMAHFLDIHMDMFDNIIDERRTPVLYATTIQQRMYALNRRDKLGAYNISIAFDVEGEWQPDLFKQAIHSLIRRHETLRTSFQWEGEHLLLDIHEEFSLDISEIVLDKNTSLTDVENSFSQQFDLSNNLLIRVAFIKQDLMRHTVLLDMPHITIDGVSWKIITQDFLELVKGKSLLPSKQFKDFAHNERLFLRSPSYQTQKRYWEEHLADIEPRDILPTDYERSNDDSTEGDTIDFFVSSHDFNQLTAVARKYQVSINSLLMSIYGKILAQYMDHNDFFIGSAFSTRKGQDSDKVVGTFINTLPIRIKFSEEIPFQDFVRITHNNILSALRNQFVPFQDLVEIANLKRSPIPPFFDTLFIFHNQYQSSENEVTSVRGMNIFERDVVRKKSEMDLKLDIFLHYDGGLKCRLNYRTKLFKQSSIERKIEQFHQIISSITHSHPFEFSQVNDQENEPALESIEINKLNQIIWNCFKKILNSSHLRVDDDFFDNGGNSIKLVALSIELEKNGLFVDENDIMRNSTVKQLTNFIESRRGAQHE